MFLVIVLLVAAVPTAALADRTSSITVTFNAFDPDLDSAFRKWAGAVIDNYVNVYARDVYNDLLDESIAVMQEYSTNHTYRRTGFDSDDYEYDPYSLNYEALYMEDPKQAEELLELAYLEQLSESVQEHAEKLYLGNLDGSVTGKWLTLDAKTGQWTYSYQLEAVTKMEQNKLIENAIDTAIKAIDGAVKVYTVATALDGKDPNKTFESLWKGVTSAATKINDEIFAYLNDKLQDQLYVSLKNDIVNNIKYADDAAVTYLRKTYVESAEYVLKGTTDITEQDIIFPTQRKREIFKKSVDKLLAAYEAQKAEAQDIAEKIISGTETLDVQTLKAKCNSFVIIEIITIELARSAIKIAIDSAKNNFYKKKGSSKPESAFGDVDISTSWVGDSLYDALNGAVDATCTELINSATEGTKITWSGWLEAYKKNFVKSLKDTLANINKESWSSYGGSFEKSDALKAGSAQVTKMIITLMEIQKAYNDTKDEVAFGNGLNELAWEGVGWIVTCLAAKKVTASLEDKADLFKTLKGNCEAFLKAVDPAHWADVGVGIVNTARDLHDAKSGNAASNLTGFKMYQIWEVGSKGIDRLKGSFPSLDDAADSNKTTWDELAQKISQILTQLKTDATCITELLTILNSKSDLKEAIVSHFEEKGMTKEKLVIALNTQYSKAYSHYTAWSNQQQHNFPEYFK